MEMEERVKKDIELFEKNIVKIKNKGIKDMATRYYEDAKYYLQKGDYFTSFGCINYAHGLIDSILNKKGIIVEIKGSAGSGKTYIIERAVENLRYDYKIGAIIFNYIDGEEEGRLKKYGVETLIINTGNECPDDELVEEILLQMDADLVFIENIGISCPYVLENSKKIMVISTTQGVSVISKFPLSIQLADLVIINKIDLADGKDMEDRVKKLTDGEIIKMSCKTGEGVENLLEWIKNLF